MHKQHTPHQHVKVKPEDSRKYVRMPKQYRVQVKKLTFPLSQKYDFESHSNDIGSGGISIKSPYPLRIGEKMQVRINIPRLNKFSPGFFKHFENEAEQYFMAIAEVVWSENLAHGHHAGLQFMDTDDDQARALDGLLKNAIRLAKHKK